MKKILLASAILLLGNQSLQAQCSPDLTPPIAVCQNITVFLDGAGNASIIPADIDGGSSDNCGIVNLAVSQSTFTCANLGPNNVTLTVTDGSSNTSNCIAIVTVSDTIPPFAACQDITVFLDGAGNSSIIPADIDNGSSDNCGNISLSASQTSFTCADLGNNNVTLTATDGNSNTANCVAIVTVVETTPPNAACQDITVFLDGTGNASIVPADIDNGSSDNCGNVSLSASQTSFTSADLGINNVTLTATDDSSNTSNCIAIVTVENSVLGLISNDFDNEFLLYPNPTEGNFIINLGKTYENITATLTDLRGTKIQSKVYRKIETLNLNIDASTGVYLLIIESGDRKSIMRLVKK